MLRVFKLFLAGASVFLHAIWSLAIYPGACLEVLELRLVGNLTPGRSSSGGRVYIMLRTRQQ